MATFPALGRELFVARFSVSFGLSTLLMLGCTEVPAGPVQAPAEDNAVTHSTARFIIYDYADTPQDIIDSLGARLERDYDSVGVLLEEFDPPPTPISFSIRAGGGIPYVTSAENTITQFGRDLAPEYIPHHLTHLYTRYRRNAFIEEGIAVWVTEELVAPSEEPSPYRGQSPHAWVSLFEQHGSTISLFSIQRATEFSYSYVGSEADAVAWQLFVQAGSFAGWLIETQGWDRWLVLYSTASVGAATGLDTPEAERLWFDHAETAYPTPLDCETALGDVGPREQFWCARARGN